MRALQITFFFLVFIFKVFILQAQILDDSTKQYYGYGTLNYVHVQDVFENKSKENVLDTNLLSLHRYGYLFHNNQFYQDLGNWATPLKLVTGSQAQDVLGVQVGYHRMDPFYYHPSQIKYYDTKSPYAEVNYYQGSKGQQRIEFSVSRNISPNWNIGVDFRRMVSRKIFGKVNRTDKQSELYAFDAYTMAKSKNQRYQLMASFSHLYAWYYDNGGIKPDSGDVYNDLFDYELERVWLTNTRSMDRKYNYHLYQQFDLIKNKKLQLYTHSEYTKQTNRYDDPLLKNNYSFYDTMYQYAAPKDTTTIYDRRDVQLFENKIGFKGTLDKWFYALYYKNRSIKSIQKMNDTSIAPLNINENYGGAQLSYSFSEQSKVVAHVELGSNSNYLTSVAFNISKLEGGIKHIQYSPTLIQKNFYSPLFNWNYSFELPTHTQATLKYKIKKKQIECIPAIDINQYNKYIYYASNGFVAQDNKIIYHYQPSLYIKTNVWKIHLANAFQYNFVNHNDVIRMPAIVNATQLFWESWIFKRASQIQIGFDVMYRDRYYGYAYNALLQQFTVSDKNNSFNELKSIVTVDAFINMQIRTARLFIKMTNLTNGLVQPGYMASPYYSALPRTFDFGINWRFFD
jgi:hypothetical protein